MFEPKYLHASQMSDSGKKDMEELIDKAREKLLMIFDEPHAAKENLMKTDFKVASAAITLIGKVLQAETAMYQAQAIFAHLASSSEEAKKILAANITKLQLPE